MTTRHRIIAISLVAILLLTGFAIGRISSSSSTNAAETAQPADATRAQAQVQGVSTAAATEDKFYLSDYKAGYNDGYNALSNNQSGVSADTSRPGYNQGFKEGYADA